MHKYHYTVFPLPRKLKQQIKKSRGLCSPVSFQIGVNGYIYKDNGYWCVRIRGRTIAIVTNAPRGVSAQDYAQILLCKHGLYKGE